MKHLTFALVFASFSLYQLCKTCPSVQGLRTYQLVILSGGIVSNSGTRIASEKRYISLFIRSCQEENARGEKETAAPASIPDCSDYLNMF